LRVIPSRRGTGSRSAERRPFMSRSLSLLLCAVAALAPSAALAQRPAVKVGLLLPYTGVLSVEGTDVTNGIELFLKKVGGRAGGREVQLLKEDDEAKPAVGINKLKTLGEGAGAH